MAILKIKDKGVWKEIQAIKGDTGHDVYVGDKSKAPSEAKLIIEPVKGTATGTDIQITDSVNDRVSKLGLDGKSTQETRSGKNLANLTRPTFTNNGVTFTYNGDGTYTLNGTAAAEMDNQLLLPENYFEVSSDKYYKISLTKFSGDGNILVNARLDINGTSTWNWIQSGGAAKKPSANGAINLINAYIRKDSEFINLRIGIQVEVVSNESSPATSWEQYGVSPSPDYPSEIENVKGKNLINPNLPVGSVTESGITLINNGDGSYTVKGTSTSLLSLELTANTKLSGSENPIKLKANTYYTHSIEILNGTMEGVITLAVVNNDNVHTFNYLNVDGTRKAITKMTKENLTLWTYNFYCGKAGITVDCTFRLQLEEGSVATRYVPYGNIQIVETGKNLWQPYSNITSSGITLTQQSNGNILLNGTATGDTFFRIALNKFINEATTLSCNYKSGTIKGGSVFVRTRTSKSILNHSIDIGPTTTTGIKLEHKTAENYYQEITIQKGAILSNVLLEIMLLKGTYNETNLSDYKPYTEEVVNIALKGNELTKYDKLIIKDGKATIKKKSRHLSLAVTDMNNDDNYPGWKNVPYIGKDYPNQNNKLSNFCNYKSNITNTYVALNSLGGGSTLILFKTLFGGLTQTEIKEQYPDLVFNLIYELAEPYEIDLGEVSMLTTYEGTSNITNSEDAEMSIEYDTNKTNLYYQNNGNIIKINKGS